MADTRWTDPANWTFADCSDNSKQPLISHLWETWKEAADERVAFTEVEHIGGFTDDNTFPDLIGDLINFGAQTPKNSIRIKNAVYPEKAIDTDSINSSGTFTGTSDAPDDLTLSELLTGPLGYASGVLLHDTETDSGDQNALFRMPWFVQWFEVMNYPQYYERLLFSVSGGSPYMTDVESQYVEVEVEYKFQGLVFKGATAFVTTPESTSTPVDVYVANDLNEASPFSTREDVRDYADGVLAANSASWNSGANITGSEDIGARIVLFDGIVGGETLYRATLTNKRIRFKVKDNFRSTSPDKFTPDVFWNGFYNEKLSIVGGVSQIKYDFGSGETDQEMQFFELSKVGDWYYLSLVQSGGTLPDYTGFDFAIAPKETTIADTERETLSSFGTGINFVMFNPNRTDGTGFEFYSP